MVFWDAVIAVRVVAACGHVERERPPGAQYGSTGMPCQRPSSAIGLGRRDRATGQAPRGSCSGGVPKDITARWPTRCGARGPGLLHLTHADLLACLTRACASQVLMDRLICRVRDGRAGRLPAIDGRFDPPAGPSCWHNSQGGSGFDSPRRAGGGTASLRAAVVGKHFRIRRRRRAGCCPPPPLPPLHSLSPPDCTPPRSPRSLRPPSRADAACAASCQVSMAALWLPDAVYFPPSRPSRVVRPAPVAAAPARAAPVGTPSHRGVDPAFARCRRAPSAAARADLPISAPPRDNPQPPAPHSVLGCCLPAAFSPPD